MNHSQIRGGRKGRYRLISLVLTAAVAFTTACRRPQVSTTGGPEVRDLPAGMRSNTLASVPGAVHARAAGSPIRWQPWTPEVIPAAEEANRLIFAMIVLPQQPLFQQILADLAADPARVETINRHYLPVLIDGDACREMGLLTADLCAELGQGLSLPLFLWLSPAGDPVAWRPALDGSASLGELFTQSHTMVSRMWNEDPEYVRQNSAHDNAGRRKRLEARAGTMKAAEDPAAATLAGIRQLSSLYDPVSRSFDLAGGLFPSGTLDLLATAALQPGIPAEVSDRSRQTIHGLSEDILPSAMFDPLDGGLFTSRRGGAWDLPVFTRDCITQARAAYALLQLHRATGDPLALERALGSIGFAEKSYRTPRGLFSMGVERPTDTEDWLWRVEEVESALPPDDAAWWIRVTGMRGLGNLLSESDPERRFFRSNTIGMPGSVADIAADLNREPEEFALRHEAARKLLLKVREKRLGDRPGDDIPHAPSTFRMVSAYAAAFAATGDERHREAAVRLIAAAREAFGDGPRLRVFTQEEPRTITEGRAFLYALAIQSALDVADISSDESWVDWAADLATTASEIFVSELGIVETPPVADLIGLPVLDLTMLFDDSTAGLFSMASARLESRGRSIAPGLADAVSALPANVVERPILYTDRMLAGISAYHAVTVLTGPELSRELRLEVERLPLRTIHRLPAAPGGVPAGSVEIRFPGGETRLVGDVDLLREALLPSARKQ